MGPLLQIDIAGAIRLVFYLNDWIIIYHMMTLLSYLMVVRLIELSLSLIILWLESLSRFMLIVGHNRDFQWRPITYENKIWDEIKY